MEADPNTTSPTQGDTSDREKWFNQAIQDLRGTTSALEGKSNLTELVLTSMAPLRIVGYLLLLAEISDFFSMLVGSQFMNPAWEWATFGIVTQQMPVLLIASVFILLGGRYSRGNFERRALQIFYWWLLIAGIGYLLTLPLAASNLLRLSGGMADEHARQAEQIDAQTAKAQQRLDDAATDPAIASVVAPGLPSAELGTRLQQLGERVADENKMMQGRALSGYTQQRQKMVKQAITWFSQAIIAGIALLLLWHKSNWIRDCQPNETNKPASREIPNFFERLVLDWRHRPVKLKPKAPPKPPLRVRLFGDGRKPVKPKKR